MQIGGNELGAYYNINATTAELGNMGLQIHTTINQHLMSALYNTIAAEKRQMAALGTRLPPYVHISAVLEKPGTGRILAFYGGPRYGIKHRSLDPWHVETVPT